MAAGTATVTVEATDPSGLTFSQAFSATVNPPPNRAPVALGTIPPETLMARGISRVVDVSGIFHDIDGDTLRYTAISDNTGVVSVTLSDTRITLIPEGEGSASVTVTASDGELSVSLSIAVSIMPYVGAEAWMPDANLRAAVRTALGLQPNDVLTQQMMAGLTVLSAASNAAGTGVQDITGLEHATQLTRLDLGRTGVRDLTPLQDLTHLTHLTLWYTEISDLTPLQGLTNLVHLNLHQTTPRGFSPLQGLINLTYLDIGRTQIRDLTPLSGLTALTSLNLSFNNANNFNTPGDLTPLSGLTALTSLNLGYTSISDITALKGLTALTYLDLKSNQISDISPVSGLTNLVRLYLDVNQISDVSALEGLTSLQFLRLKYNPIADVAPLRRLKANNPSVNIDVDIEVQAPDLRVESVSVNKTTIVPGETFRLDAVVKNQGEADASAITVRYYQSTDETISTTDTERQTATLELIAVDGMREPWAQLTAPDTPGTYYYGICIDAVEHESDTANNCSTGVAVTVLGADLLVDSVSVNKNTVTPGETFQLNAVVKSLTADSTATTIRYYLSADETISDADTQVHTTTLPIIAANATREASVQLTALDTPGTYYYGICIDDIAHETDTTNNCSTAVAITVGGADIVVESVSVNKTGVAPSETFRLNAIVKNQGEADASAITVRYYQSTDDTISTTDTELNTTTLGVIAVDGTNEPSVQFTAPEAPGVYYYGICIDAVGGETDTTNNCSVAVAVTVGGADFVIDSVRAGNTTVNPSETFRLTAVVRNQGKSTATPTVLHYYLSTDDTISATDTLITTLNMAALAADASSEPWAQLTAPDTPGTYYYGVCIDAVGGETDTTNNCSVAVAVTVEGADLMIDGTPQVSKTILAVGETFQINTRVWNQGRAISAATTLRYYLSADEIISSADTEVDSDPVDALSGRGASATRRRAELSKTLTAPDTPGVHYYGVCVDSVAGDANTVNNCSQALAITVEAPPPEPVVVQVPGDPESLEAVDIQGPDLIISTVRVDASTIKIGGGVRFHITLTNQGTSKAPATIIRYYRSTDATISTEDTELRAVPVGELGSGKSYTTWALLPSAFSVGTYYYGACLDAVASEFDTTNNCSDAIEITVEAQGKPLLVAIGSISRQVLWVGGPPQTLNVSGHFVGKVETWTASSSKPSVVIASMSDSKVILTPVGKGWAVVTIEAVSGDLVAKQTFSVSIGGDAVSAPDIPDISGPDLSPEVSIPDANLRTAVQEALGLAEGTPITQQKMARLTRLIVINNTGIQDLTGLEHAANLTGLHLYSNQISDITPLAHLTNLTGLHLYNNRISDITPLAHLTNLTELDLRESPINNFTPLGSLTALTTLLLDGTQISDLTPLRNLTALNVLFLNRNQISDVTPLTNLTALTELQLTVNQISDASPLEGLTSLKRLALGRNSITDLAPLHRLREKNPSVSIDIIYVPVTQEPEVPDTTAPEVPDTPDTSSEVSIPDENLRQAVRASLVPSEGPITQQRMAELKEIYVERGRIRDLTGLEYATQLSGLNVRINEISDLSPLENLTNLRSLNLGQSQQINDLSPLENLTNLTYLEIGYIEIGGSQINDLSPLTRMTALTDLILVGHQIGDISPLAGLTSLTKILLHDNQINGISALQNLTALTWLDLHNNQISDISALQNLTALRYLDLNGNQISGISALQNLTALTRLDLHNNQISDISALQNLTALSSYLGLHDNQISDVTPLENLTSLRNLNLAGNPIADLAPLRRLKENNPSMYIDIDINADLNNAPLAPSAPLIPAETALLSNYPNPFNPETWIPYQLAKSAEVTLSIYDVRGVVVRRLVLGHRPAGFYRSRGRAAHWDGRNQLGEKVATGLYFYTLTAGEFTATGKMLIQK